MGCDTSKFSPLNRTENLWNQNGRKVILFVGRLVEKKGTEYLIKAMEGLDAKLVIVGSGPEGEKLRKLRETVDADIEFAGAKDKNALIEIFASCDVFCLPSVLASDGDKDGTPVVLIEAMASGAPVVGTKIGGIPDVIRDGENGYLVEQKDVEGLRSALRELLMDDEKRKRFSEASRRIAEAYDYKVIGEKYKQIIECMNGK
jgi:glycosyltransferase involved in cell wall biosynthesis